MPTLRVGDVCKCGRVGIAHLTRLRVEDVRKSKRTVICTFVALVSGFSGSYIGGQVSLQAHWQNCQTQPPGVKTICKAWVTPEAIWQGSTTGLWVGYILGAFVSGLATRQNSV